MPVAGRGAFPRGERGGVLPCAQELGHAAVATRVEERACLGLGVGVGVRARVRVRVRFRRRLGSWRRGARLRAPYISLSLPISERACARLAVEMEDAAVRAAGASAAAEDEERGAEGEARAWWGVGGGGNPAGLGVRG